MSACVSGADLGKNIGAEHQRRRGSEDVEVIELDGRADEARHHDLADAGRAPSSAPAAPWVAAMIGYPCPASARLGATAKSPQANPSPAKQNQTKRPWFSLVLFVRIRDFSMGYRIPNKNFSPRPSPRRQAPRKARRHFRRPGQGTMDSDFHKGIVRKVCRVRAGFLAQPPPGLARRAGLCAKARPDGKDGCVRDRRVNSMSALSPNPRPVTRALVQNPYWVHCYPHPSRLGLESGADGKHFDRSGKAGFSDI